MFIILNSKTFNFWCLKKYCYFNSVHKHTGTDLSQQSTAKLDEKNIKCI